MRRLDPQSLGEHLDRLYRAAWALCGSREDAEDLVQDTFARVLARPRHIRGESDLAYLMQVLRNTFLTSRRTASRRPRVAATLEDFELADPRRGTRPEDAVATGEVFEAIAGLPEPFRLALIAVDIIGLSYREAGKALDTPEATVTTRLYRARQQVMAAMSPPQTEEPAAPPDADGSFVSNGRPRPHEERRVADNRALAARGQRSTDPREGSEPGGSHD
jgi:RNA polymerase sigma-70 factor (ECF subfamily)